MSDSSQKTLRRDPTEMHGGQMTWVQIRPWKADPVFTGVQRQGVEDGVVSVRSFD